jgi:tryptophan halogenase
MLLGLGYRPQKSLPVLNLMDDNKALAVFQTIKDRTDYLCRTLPTQYEYLTSIYHPQKRRGVALGDTAHINQPTSPDAIPD